MYVWNDKSRIFKIMISKKKLVTRIPLSLHDSKKENIIRRISAECDLNEE